MEDDDVGGRDRRWECVCVREALGGLCHMIGCLVFV